jgi:hypothetical protein
MKRFQVSGYWLKDEQRQRKTQIPFGDDNQQMTNKWGWCFWRRSATA